MATLVQINIPDSVDQDKTTIYSCFFDKYQIGTVICPLMDFLASFLLDISQKLTKSPKDAYICFWTLDRSSHILIRKI